MYTNKFLPDCKIITTHQKNRQAAIKYANNASASSYITIIMPVSDSLNCRTGTKVQNNYEAQTLFLSDCFLVACQHNIDPKHTIHTPCQKGTESGALKSNELNSDDNIGVK